jgi:hypothetical protein
MKLKKKLIVSLIGAKQNLKKFAGIFSHSYIPYAIAMKLKELGFDYQTVNFYVLSNQNLCDLDIHGRACYYSDYNKCNCRISAPLYQEAIKFFREKYNLSIEVTYSNELQLWKNRVNPIIDDCYKYRVGLAQTNYKDSLLDAIYTAIDYVEEMYINNKKD